MPRVPLIAIVDDDDALRNSLDNLLRSVGFRAQGFSSAEAFLNSSQLPDTALRFQTDPLSLFGLSCIYLVNGTTCSLR